jgi:hypothetical protein
MSDAYSSFGKRGVAFGFDSLALGGRIRMKFQDGQAMTFGGTAEVAHRS